MTYPIASPVTNGLMGAGHAQFVEAGLLFAGTAGGTASALTVATGKKLTGLMVNQVIGLKTGASANSGAATLNVDGLGAKAIQRNGAALTGGELPASTNVWLQYDGTAWQVIGGAAGALSLPVTALTGSYTVVAADAGKLFDCTGSFSITLPAASGAPNGFSVTALNSGTGSVTVAAASGTIGGVASMALNQSEWAIFVSSGTAWKVLKGATVSATGPVWSATDKDPSLVASENATRLTATGSGQYGSARAVNAFSDKRYYEFDVLAVTSPTTSPYLGFATATASLASGARFSASANGWSYSRAGSKENGGTITAFGSSFGAGDNVGWAVDPAAGKAWVRVNGVYQGSGDPATGANPTFTFTPGLTLYPAAYLDGNSVATDIRLRKLVNYAAPAGFSTF